MVLVIFFKEIIIKKPKIFLEVGVFHGVTARNVCEAYIKFMEMILNILA